MQGRQAAASNELAVACHGIRLVLSVDEAGLLPRLVDQLPPKGYRETGRRDALPGDDLREYRLRITSRPRHSIEQDGVCVDRPPCEVRLLDSVERHVDRLVAENSPGLVGLHAGVVGFDGGALLVVGSSHSGKSTLVQTLVQSGGLYFSDDLAMVDDSLRVYPYPRPLRRRVGARERRLDPLREFGRAAGAHRLPVRWVVLSTYRPGARFEPVPLEGGAAVLALLRHTISARRAPQRALELLGRLVQAAQIWTGERGECRPAAVVRRLVHGPEP